MQDIQPGVVLSAKSHGFPVRTGICNRIAGTMIEIVFPNGDRDWFTSSDCEIATPDDKREFFPYTEVEISDCEMDEKYVAKYPEDTRCDHDWRLYIMAAAFFRRECSSGKTFARPIR